MYYDLIIARNSLDVIEVKKDNEGYKYLVLAFWLYSAKVLFMEKPGN